MTIPAIAPPERKLWVPSLVVAAVAFVADGTDDDVDDGNKGGIEAVAGSVTPSQRPVTFEPTQHESVAFGELDAQ